mmetsp:Transcript_48644/g.87401  ORF Transcript_48644/g.87401 Transcript_48644/m.87401 type:complete len:261 (+) Transcript_48644:1340-2122(+)
MCFFVAAASTTACLATSARMLNGVSSQPSASGNSVCAIRALLVTFSYHCILCTFSASSELISPRWASSVHLRSSVSSTPVPEITTTLCPSAYRTCPSKPAQVLQPLEFAACASKPVPTTGLSGHMQGTACCCILAPICARLASSCSRNGMWFTATEVGGPQATYSTRSGGQAPKRPRCVIVTVSGVCQDSGVRSSTAPPLLGLAGRQSCPSSRWAMSNCATLRAASSADSSQSQGCFRRRRPRTTRWYGASISPSRVVLV